MMLRIRRFLLLLAVALSYSGASAQEGGSSKRYEGAVIFARGTDFTFFPCGGHPKFGWRGLVSDEVFQRLAHVDQTVAHRGDMVHITCMGYVRPAADSSKNVGMLPYDFHLTKLLEVRHVRSSDCRSQ